MKILVAHEHYGCETGCCGHVVYLDDKKVGDFDFMHCSDEKDALEYAKEEILRHFGKEHCKTLDWGDVHIEYEGCS